jgi:superfamily II DNA or RNA helicase
LLVVVNNTFANPQFQGLLAGIHDNLLLVADEMHNLGAPRLRRSLPDKANFRLGLSATPDRHGDEQGTKALADYFGPPVLEFGLKEAIEHGFLCQYYYHPVIVPLTEDEMSVYKELSVRIARAYASDGDDDGPSDLVKRLLIERARLVGKAENKTIKLLPLLEERRTSQFNLVYCGDAKDGDGRQVDRVLRLIGTRIRMRANRFTAEETPTEREELLRDFASGRLQALVAIRCLDEGVDVPRTETAYILASSTNPRQFIQRRGRVLRRAPGKHTATIYDFITVPDLDDLASAIPPPSTSSETSSGES